MTSLTFNIESSNGSNESKERCAKLSVGDKSIQTPSFILYTKQGNPDNLTKDLLNDLPYEKIRVLQLLFNDIVQFNKVVKNYGKGIHSFLSLQEHLLYVSMRDGNVYQETTFNEQSFNVLSKKGYQKISNEEYLDTIITTNPDFFTALSFDNYWSTSQKKQKKQLDYSLKNLNNLIQNDKIDNTKIFANVFGGKNEETMMKMNKEVAVLPVGGFTLSNFGTNESEDQRLYQIKNIINLLPTDKPRLITGVGMPEQILSLIELGIDLFNTNYPNMMTEFGHALIFKYKYDELKELTKESTISLGDNSMNLWDTKYVIDATPIDSQCKCFTCINHTRAYIHHLLNTHEMLSQVLLTIHNVSYYTSFFNEIRNTINNSTFKEYKEKFLIQRSIE